MTKEETLIRGILDPVGSDVRPLVCAVQITGRLLFEERLLLIGRQIKDIRAPRGMLFYLAYYCRFNMPYYEVLKQNPQLLFGEDGLQKEDA